MLREPLRIDCADCVMRDTDACADCVVTFICSREPGDALIIDADEERAVRLLIKGGLVPELRHEVRDDPRAEMRGDLRDDVAPEGRPELRIVRDETA